MLIANQRSSIEFRFIIRDLYNDKNPYDLTNCTVYFNVKEYPYDPEGDILISKSSDGNGIVIISAPYGAISVALTPDDLNLMASRYVFDVYVVTSDGKRYNCGAALMVVKPSIPYPTEVSA